jgi:hypothetical protein
MVYTDLLLPDAIEVGVASSAAIVEIAPLNIETPVDNETFNLHSPGYTGTKLFLGTIIEYTCYDDKGRMVQTQGVIIAKRIKWTTNKNGFEVHDEAKYEIKVVPCDLEKRTVSRDYYSWGGIRHAIAVGVPWHISKVVKRQNNFDPDDLATWFNEMGFCFEGTVVPATLTTCGAEINGNDAVIPVSYATFSNDLFIRTDHYKQIVDQKHWQKVLQAAVQKKRRLPNDPPAESAAEEGSVQEESAQQESALPAVRAKPKNKRKKAAGAGRATSSPDTSAPVVEGQLDEEEEYVPAQLNIPEDPDAWMVIAMQTSILTWPCTQRCTYVFLFP